MLYVPELTQLSRLQQKNLAFAAERLGALQPARGGGHRPAAPTTLVAAGWEEALLARLFDVWLAGAGAGASMQRRRARHRRRRSWRTCVEARRSAAAAASPPPP
ncbi:MAG: hypothetical protein MZW92_76205 [Comamonadaceae bacterium]|nr:hypothetical protein [Comamonadaceae bacterium]